MGVLWDFIKAMVDETYPAKSTWSTDDMPDQTGKVVIVTGGGSGLGYATVKALLEHGATVYLVARSQGKGEQAIRELAAATGRTARLLLMDVSDLDSISRAVREFLDQESRLDVIYNSAGLMIPPIECISPQKYDIQFATHVIGPFFLTRLLLPVLISTAKTYNTAPRVINVSSGAHHLHSIAFGTIKDGPERRKMSTKALYAQSKYAVVVFAREFARRYADTGVVSLSLNPGNIKTDLQQGMSPMEKFFAAMMLYPIDPYGVVTYLWAGTAPETAGYNGKYLIPWARLGTPRIDTQDPDTGAKLWEYLEAQMILHRN